jgi:hypothetical protein
MAGRIEDFEYGYPVGIGPSPGNMEYGDVPFIAGLAGGSGSGPASGSGSGSGIGNSWVFVKEGGTWMDAAIFVKEGGTWMDAAVFVKAGGSWTA